MQVDIFQGEDSSSSQTERGIYFTNCFTLGNDPRSPTGMLPILSRINHSCCPNTEFHWDSGLSEEHLRATRDIREGEELLDCYLDLNLPGRLTRDQRRNILRGGYGFWCDCQFCDKPQSEVAAQDRLRQEAFTLSEECRIHKITNFDQSHLESIRRKAERMLELRKLLNMKLIHQIEAVEVVFHLAMLTENIEKVRTSSCQRYQSLCLAGN